MPQMGPAGRHAALTALGESGSLTRLVPHTEHPEPSLLRTDETPQFEHRPLLAYWPVPHDVNALTQVAFTAVLVSGTFVVPCGQFTHADPSDDRTAP